MEYSFGMGMSRQKRWGANIRRNRLALGMTQIQLAHAVDTSQGTVANYESGRIVPRDARRDAIAAALSCDVDDLFPIDGHRGQAIEQEAMRYRLALREIATHPRATAAIKRIAREALAPAA